MWVAEALVGVLVLVTGAAGAGSGAAPDPLRVGVAPGRLKLAEGSRATVRVACARAQPAVAASAGRIEALREVASGVYEGEYVPPESLEPQVTFVTARCGESFGWAPVALVGVRDITVPARYGTSVAVSVEGEQFGPAAADATGRAALRVAVPPGVRHATWRNQRIDLGVQPHPFLAVSVEGEELEASRSGTLAVHVLAVDERGAPLAAGQVFLTASEGTVPARVDVRGGEGRAGWALSPGPLGEAILTARLPGTRQAAATAALRRVAGAPRRLALEVSRAVMVAGESEELEVTALLDDAGGNPTDAEVMLVASGGTVVEWERAAPGRHAGRVLVPSRRSGPPELALEAVSGALVARRTVTLAPGPVREAHVLPRGDLAADGRARELRVTVVDAYENRVDVREPPLVTAGHGDVGEPVRYAPGAYRVSYRAPLAASDLVDVVRVSIGDVESTTRLHLRALGGGITVAPKLGFTLGDGGVRSPAGGLELGIWLPWIRGLGLLLEGSAFGLGRSDTVRAVRVRSDATFVALAASLAWRRPWWGGLGWVAAGGGAVRTAATVSATGQPELAGEAWAPAVQAAVGWGAPLGPGTPFGELAVGWQRDPGTGPLRGALRTVTFGVGYRLDVL